VDPDLTIETERLILRPLRPADFEALLAYESREDVARWLYWGPRTAEEVRERLDRKVGFRSIHAEGDVLSFGITVKGTDDVPVGDIILQLVSEEQRTGEIGFIVHPDHQGRGYATEAGQEMLRIAFGELGMHRVIGRTEARNAGSARALEKLGMRLEAHLVENEWVKGEWQSELVYAILDREWRERQARTASVGPPNITHARGIEADPRRPLHHGTPMSDGPVIVFASFRPLAGQERAVAELLGWMVGNTRAEPGCERYDLYRASAEGQTFHLFERYSSAEALDAHRAAAYFVEYRRRIADLIEGPVDVTLLTPVDVAG
jgi:RimJ/RimL family protein N-acetyltransferase/quinol monooxygenase YgiN